MPPMMIMIVNQFFMINVASFTHKVCVYVYWCVSSDCMLPLWIHWVGLFQYKSTLQRATHKCWDFSLSLKLGSHASPSQLQPAYTWTFLTGLRPDWDYLEHNLVIWHICIVIGHVWPLSQCSMWSDSSLLCSIINKNQLLFIFFLSARSHSMLAASQEMVWNSCSSKFGLSSSSSKDIFSSAWLILAVLILWV